MPVIRALSWIAVALLLLVVAAVLYVSFADLGWLKPRIESAVAKTTGRELTLGGRFDVDIVPSPAVTLEDVSFANAQWSSEPTMARIGRLSVRLDGWSLLSGPIVVETFQLHDVDLLLETNAQGEPNWVLGDQAPAQEEEEAPDEPSQGLPLIIDDAQVTNLNVRYVTAQAEPLKASLRTLQVSREDRSNVLRGEGEFDGMPVHLEGSLGPLRARNEGLDFQLTTDISNLSLDLDGSLGATPSGLALTAVATSDDISKLLEHYKIELPIGGEMNVRAEVEGTKSGNKLNLDVRAGDLSATLDATQRQDTVDFKAAIPALAKVGEAFEVQGLPAQDLALDGRVVVAEQGYELQGIKAQLGEARFELDGNIGKDTDAGEFTLTASGPSLAALSGDLPEMPFDASLSGSLAPGHIALDPLQASFGDSDLAGSLEVTTAERTAVTARLKSKQLDLSKFVAPSEESTAEAPAEEPDKEESKYVFVEEPLPFEQLRKTDLDIDADIGRFSLNKIVLKDLVTAVDLKSGKLNLTNRFHGPHGGRSVSQVSVDASGKSAAVDAKINMRDLRLNLISGDVKAAEALPPVGVTVDIKASGASPRALASAASGRVLFTQGEGKMENDLLEKFSGDIGAQLFKALNPFAKEDKTTGLDCTIVALKLEDGETDIKGLLFQTEKVKATGDGNIDLNTEKLNIEFNTKPRSGVGVSADMFVTPFVKLTGTLASPSIGLDKKGALLVGAAVATGGLALVAKGAADRATGEIDSCKTLLEEVGGHPEMPE